MEGPGQKKKERKEGGCKRQGVGKENSQSRIRVWRLGGLWAGLGYSLAILKTFLFCKFNFGKLIFENGDDCLGKTFSNNFRKIK